MMAQYLSNTRGVLNSATGRFRTNNGFMVNLLKRYQGNDTIRTSAIKRMQDGSYIEQITMDYGNGAVATMTTRNNIKKPFFSIVFKRDGKVTSRCIQSGDSFVYENSFITLDKQGRRIRKNVECRKNGDINGFKMENGRIVSDKLDDYSIKSIIDYMRTHFRSLG